MFVDFGFVLKGKDDIICTRTLIKHFFVLKFIRKAIYAVDLVKAETESYGFRFAEPKKVSFFKM